MNYGYVYKRCAIATEQFPGNRYRRDRSHTAMDQADAFQREYRSLRALLEWHIRQSRPSQVSFGLPYVVSVQVLKSKTNPYQSFSHSILSLDAFQIRRHIPLMAYIPILSIISGWLQGHKGAKGPPHRPFRFAPSNMVSCPIRHRTLLTL